MKTKTLFKKKRAQGVSYQELIVIKDNFSKFFRQSLAVALALFIITSFAPNHVLEIGFTADSFPDPIYSGDDYDGDFDLPLIITDEGYVLKTSPASEEASRIGYTDTVRHTVVGGDTLSGIASLYGISLKTLLWENNLNEESTLRVGQILNIPALDGVTHIAGKNETLSGIAQKYTVDQKLIAEHNNLEGESVTEGQKLFIPGGTRKAAPQVVVRSGVRGAPRAAGGGAKVAVISPDEALPSGSCTSFIMPTDGKLTQGFRPGHPADDFANSSRPDIKAACAGKAVKVVTECQPRVRGCAGGYGNHIIIDHGGNTQTLYAHLGAVYINVGDYVTTGQPIAQMSNTGRVYGATGIHLHIELYVNGQKKNFMKYL